MFLYSFQFPNASIKQLLAVSKKIPIYIVKPAFSETASDKLILLPLDGRIRHSYRNKKFYNIPIYAAMKMRISRKEISQILKHHFLDLVELLLSCDMPVDTSASAIAFKLQSCLQFFHQYN